MKKNRRVLFFAWIAALSILFSVGAVYADDGTLRVTCIDSSGNPVGDVRVVAFNVNSSKNTSRKSDPQGIAEFAKLDSGIYRVFGHRDGFEPAFFEYIALKDAPQTVSLTFVPGADRKLYFEDPVEAQKMKALIRQGVDALNSGKTADAEKLLKQALQLDPYAADALYYYGSALLSLSQFDRGEAALKRAADIAGVLSAAAPPGNADPNQKLIDAVQQTLKKDLPALKGESLLKEKKYDEALKNFAEAAQNDPANPALYADMAIANANSNKIDDALASVEKAMALKPGDPKLLDLKASISDLKEKIKQKETKDKADAAIAEGDRLLSAKDFSGAIKNYEEAVAWVAPALQATLWAKICVANANLNRNNAVIAAYKKTIALAPSEVVRKLREALIADYLHDRKYEEAIQVAEIKTDPSQDAELILVDLAGANKDKDPAFAEAILERVLKINPNNADAYFNLGQLYYMDGKSKDRRTKELLTKYLAIGKNAEKLQQAKDFLVVVNRRTK
jgi:tetratricopeptide (TPR) repeat protein